jgi:hypothetical protein
MKLKFFLVCFAVISFFGCANKREQTSSLEEIDHSEIFLPVPTKENILSSSLDAPQELYDYLKAGLRQHTIDSICNINGELYVVLPAAVRSNALDSLGLAFCFLVDGKGRGTQSVEYFDEFNSLIEKLPNRSMAIKNGLDSGNAVTIDFKKICTP